MDYLQVSTLPPANTWPPPSPSPARAERPATLRFWRTASPSRKGREGKGWDGKSVTGGARSRRRCRSRAAAAVGPVVGGWGVVRTLGGDGRRQGRVGLQATRACMGSLLLPFCLCFSEFCSKREGLAEFWGRNHHTRTDSSFTFLGERGQSEMYLLVNKLSNTYRNNSSLCVIDRRAHSRVLYYRRQKQRHRKLQP
jgi:hypothetical protein